MERDAQQLRDGATIDTDVCIVGAGPAGLTLARELIDQRCRVVCLESGGLTREERAQSLNEGDFIGARYAGLTRTRHRQVGGTACTWNTPVRGESGAKYVPLDSCDFRPRPDHDHVGWPFERAVLEPHYRRAQQVCELGPFSYDGDEWCDQRKTFPLRDANVARSVYQFGAASVFTRSHVDAVVDSDNVELLYHATACALREDGAGTSVSSLDAVSFDGARFRVTARIFVLAGGAIENARLLLVSREPGRAAPGDDHDLLGRFFMEHPRDRSMVLIPNDPDVIAMAAFYDRQVTSTGTVIGGRIALSESAIEEHGLLNASVTLLPLPRSGSPAMGLLTRVVARATGRTMRSASGGYGWSQAPRPAEVYRGFQLLMNTEQRALRDNRVVLGSKVDRFGVAMPEVHWRWRAQDQGALERVRDVFVNALSSPDVGRVEIDHSSTPDPNAHHHAGTTRMHEDPEHGVVDADSRVHGRDNLYVTGASVFPTAGYANPTLTIVALALRLAEHLKARL